jgi:hypothetical protein
VIEGPGKKIPLTVAVENWSTELGMRFAKWCSIRYLVNGKRWALILMTQEKDQ